MRIQSAAIEDIDTKFHLEKNNDFELRLWTFSRTSDYQLLPTLFILSNKSGKWNARYFKDIAINGKIKELSLKTEGLEQLWKHLNENDVLTIPEAFTLEDKNGEPILQDKDGVLFSFELLSRNAVRHFAYKCPTEFANKFDYLQTYKKVAEIVRLIFNYVGENKDMLCTIGVQHRLFATVA